MVPAIRVSIMTSIALDKHAFNGPPRRIGSSWSAIEANPPSKTGWRDHNQRKNWNWQPRRKGNGLRTPRQNLSPEDQARALLAKLLTPKE